MHTFEPNKSECTFSSHNFERRTTRISRTSPYIPTICAIIPASICQAPTSTTISSIVGNLITGAINELENLTGLLGAHLIRKFRATRVQQCGAMRDDCGISGRWKQKRSFSDVYDDVELPWPDMKHATYLCTGGPCKYKIKKESGIDNYFILFYFIVYYGGYIDMLQEGGMHCIGFCTTFLYFYPRRENHCSIVFFNSVRENYNRLHNKELNTNPVEQNCADSSWL